MKIMRRAAKFIKLTANIEKNRNISVLLLAVILAGCLPGGSSTPITNPPLSMEAASAEETAAWLENPDEVERGVWSLLENLGIGVYTQEAEQILAGSERNADDFFLFDFEVSLLVSHGQKGDRPFSDFHQMLVPYGLTMSQEELQTFYRTTYEAHSDEWLAQLFLSMGLDFEGDIRLTPMQEWLLFLDTFVPPNGKETSASTGSSKGLMALVTAQRAQADFCDAVRGNNADVAWSLAWQAAGTASDAAQTVLLGPMSFFDPKDLLHAIMMMMGVETKIEKSALSAHESHDGDKDTVTFTVSVKFTGDFPAEIVSCAAILGFDVPPKGPIEGVRVKWDLGDVLGQHGYFDKGGGVMFTDEEGKSEVIWEARREPSGGEGEEYTENGTVEAVVRIQQGDVFNIFAGLQEFFLPRTETITIPVGWHESDWILSMSIQIEEQISGGDLSAFYSWEGQFTVDENYNLHGEGTVFVMGRVSFPLLDNVEGVDCPPADLNGGFPFVIGGEQALKPVGLGFMLDISSSVGGVFIGAGGDEVCQTLKDRVARSVVDDFIYNIMDYVPLGMIWIEAKDGETAEYYLAEGNLKVMVLSNR